MRTQKLLASVGLCLLLAVFLLAGLRVFTRESMVKKDGRTVIRLAHWQLEGGLRAAFDSLARDYERRNPGVHIEQLAIPERIYSQWLKTQLIGGTAPEIIQLGRGSDEEMMARFFRPLGDLAAAPNPHNAGTPMEGVPLRETILDGMVSTPSFSANLIEHYAIPVSMFTVRMYYNRDLWRKILGDTPPPENYAEFEALFPRIEEYNRRTGRAILPIAGSNATAPMLIGALLQNQTQRLMQEKIAGPSLRTTGTEIGISFLRGEWTLRAPAFTDALTIARETGLRMQPGFLQLGREDATFFFMQGRALMITTGSWDSPTFRSQVGFPIGIFPLPVPSRDDPRYGHNLFGRASEAETGTGLAFGITRAAGDSASAADFLLYLSSIPGNTEFSRRSGWLPAVVGVVPPEDIAPFLPVADGYVPGFDFNLGHVGAASLRAFTKNANRLYSPQGSIDLFREAVEAELPSAIVEDLRRNVRNVENNLMRQDAALIANLALLARRPDDTALANRLDQLAETNHSLDGHRARSLAELDKIPPGR